MRPGLPSRPPSLPALGGSAREGNILPLASRRRSVRRGRGAVPGDPRRGRGRPRPNPASTALRRRVPSAGRSPGGRRVRRSAGAARGGRPRPAAARPRGRTRTAGIASIAAPSSSARSCAQQVGRPGDRSANVPAGGALDRREHLVPDRVAEVTRIPVRRIDPRTQVQRAAERLDLGALHVQERLDAVPAADRRPPGPDAAEGLQPSTPDQVQQHGLCLVVEGVTFGDHPSPDLVAHAIGGVRASDGRPRLDRGALGRRFVGHTDVHRQPQPSAEPA